MGLGALYSSMRSWPNCADNLSGQDSPLPGGKGNTSWGDWSKLGPVSVLTTDRGRAYSLSLSLCLPLAH